MSKVGARPKYGMYEVLEAARLYPDNVQAAAGHLGCTYDTFDRYMMNAGLPIIPRRSKAPIAGYKRIDWNAENVAKLKGLIDKEPRQTIDEIAAVRWELSTLRTSNTAIRPRRIATAKVAIVRIDILVRPCT